MRAYRPSLFGDERFDLEFQRGRQEKLRLYAQRARRGQPLFDPDEPQPLRGSQGGRSNLPRR